jgi:Ca-activated chloride channel homolog
MSFEFAYPWALLGLLVLPFLAWLKVRLDCRPAFLYSSVSLVHAISDRGRSRARFFFKLLRWLVLALFMVAMARPRWVDGNQQIKASGIDIVLCLDLSHSMAAEDFKDDSGQRINRLDMARKVIGEFIHDRPSDRIGLVAFAERAYLAAPLTLDHDFLFNNMARLNFDLVRNDRGTAVGAGLVASVNRLRDIKSKSKIVILMTDGRNNAGQVPPLTAAEAATALNIKVYTIGVGTTGLVPWPVVDLAGRKSYQRQKFDLDEETLQEIADRTGGKYYRADTADTLRDIYREIDELEKTKVVVKKLNRYIELLHWPIAIGLGLLLTEALLAHTWFRRLP